MKINVFFIACIVVGFSCSAIDFEVSPSCTARVRAGDGPSSRPRIWWGVSPFVKKWEILERDKAFKSIHEKFFYTAVLNEEEPLIEAFFVPKEASDKNKVPVMVLLDYTGRDSQPTNMITSRGYAFIKLKNHSFSSEVFESLMYRNSRIMDWIKTRSELDATRVALVGHNQASKLALCIAAKDERFAMAVASGSFLSNDVKLKENAGDLLRLIAPRLVYVASSTPNEKLALDAATDIYKAYKLPERVGYHVQEKDRLEPCDWEKFMDFADVQLKKSSSVYSDEIDKRIKASCDDGTRILTLSKNTLSSDGVWRLSRAIVVPDDFTLIFDGCRVELADRVQDNLIRNVGATQGGLVTNRNIRIIGRNGAILSGGKRNHYLPRRSGDANGWRSIGILLCDVVDYEIGGFSVEETQSWAISQERCAKGYLHDIVFNSSNLMLNQDGIDLRKGCHDILIENILGQTGDDTVALTALRDAPGVQKPLGMQVGGNSYLGEADDIYNVTIRNINTKCSGGHNIVRLLCADGIKIHHITIENIEETAKGNKNKSKSVLRIGDAHYSRTRPCAMGEMHNIHVKNVKSAGGTAVFVNGPICDSTFIGIESWNSTNKSYEVHAPTKNVKFE